MPAAAEIWPKTQKGGGGFPRHRLSVQNAPVCREGLV
jgi:hypothetical protein